MAEYIVIFDFPGEDGVRAMTEEDGETLVIFNDVRDATEEIGEHRMGVARIIELGDEHLPTFRAHTDTGERPGFLPDDVPIFDGMDEVVEAMFQMDNASVTDRDRPYDGQAHTDAGTRGQHEVAGVTMRDISDCIAVGFLYACGVSETRVTTGGPTWNDVYDAIAADPDFDCRAVAQNALCELERRMGIFPNLTDTDDET